MENDKKILGMNARALAMLMSIFMIDSCISTLLFGHYLITYTDYFGQMAYKTNGSDLALVLNRFATLLQILLCGTLIPMGILIAANKLISIMKNAFRGKVS